MKRRDLLQMLGVIPLALLPSVQVPESEEKKEWMPIQRVNPGSPARVETLNQYADAVEELRAEVERLKRGNR